MGRRGKKNKTFFLCLTRVFKVSSQAVITNRLCRKYNKCFLFVKISSAIPLYVIDIKLVYPILRKIMAWRIALSISYYRTPMLLFSMLQTIGTLLLLDHEHFYVSCLHRNVDIYTDDKMWPTLSSHRSMFTRDWFNFTVV